MLLAAFPLYGIGSATADKTSGLVLVGLNSIVVCFAGLIGFRLLQRSEPGVGFSYLVTRIVEAVLLGGGIILAERASVSDADITGYLLGMIVLGAGSILFCKSLGRDGWIPQPLATWGMFGYAGLAIGAFLELVTGRAISVIFAAPGGLFELALAFYLLWHGFCQGSQHDIGDRPQ